MTFRGKELAQQAASSRVDPYQSPPSIDAGKLDVVRVDEAAGRDVNQPPVENVCAEENLAGPALEPLKVERVAGKLDPPRLERADLLGRDEELTTADADLEACDRGIAAVGEAHDEILDTSELLSPAVHNGGVDDLGRRKESPVNRRHAYPPQCVDCAIGGCYHTLKVWFTAAAAAG
jgi:hypothetical protein